MDSKPNNAFVAAPCLAISAALFFVGTGLAPLWPLTWLAPIPVLWAASRLSAGRAFFGRWCVPPRGVVSRRRGSCTGSPGPSGG